MFHAFVLNTRYSSLTTRHYILRES